MPLRAEEMWLVHHIIVIFIMNIASTYLSVHHMTSIVSNTLWEGTFYNLMRRYYCNLHVVDKETEADRLSALPKFTQVARCRARIQNEEI